MTHLQISDLLSKMVHRGVVVVVALVCPIVASADDSEPAAFFVRQIEPLLRKHCFECHSHDAKAAEGGLVLDSRAGWHGGGDSGPALIPGKPDASLLMTALGYQNLDLQMPPAGRLTDREIELFRIWIADGAFDPRGSAATTPVETVAATDFDLWSLKPASQAEPPQVVAPARNEIDALILSRLHEAGLSLNEAADRYTLLRRATFDLTGLPPTLDEIERFVNDDNPDAWPRLIDRLLASPRYGERWGRHWLDVARYGDSNGGDINYAHANAWRYRDYVIQSFNNDKPYDDFIREQLAGDLLPDHGRAARRRELLTATGFLMLGPKMLAEVDTDKLLIDIVDEQLDVTGLAFLGMTFGCARCHDHKFDPISMTDYYALAGIFRSTKVIDVLRPQNGVSEWLEIDVTPDATRIEIETLTQRKQTLERQLAALGGPATTKPSSDNVATQSVVGTGLPALNSTTWSAWVRIPGPQVLGAVVSASYDGASQGHSLGFDRGQTPRVVWNHGNAPHTILTAANPVTLNVWHHLSVTFDAGRSELMLFVDGRRAARASEVASSPFSTIGVGRRESALQWPLLGDVDEVRVFDTALTDEQIAALFQKQPVEIVPVLHWSFEKFHNGFVVDETGNFDGQFQRSGSGSIVADGASGHAVRFGFPTASVPADPARLTALRSELQQVEQAIPELEFVMAVAAAEPVDLPLHIRGSHTNLGPTPVPRGTPSAFDAVLPGAVVTAGQNGRLQLANWIACSDNPLTARVMVNRIWQHHFGNGLVRSPSNFGTRGERPSHLELLDWLSREFVANDWSVKYLHRLIMNSATYRASSLPGSAAQESDPENRLLARYPVRRLEAEAIRDALLAVSGELDLTPPGRTLDLPNKQRVKIAPDDPVYDRLCRAIYLPSVRVRSYEMFSIFDVSDNGQHVAMRPDTLVAQQSLFLMNDPFVIARAERLSQRVPGRNLNDAQRINLLHLRLYGRPATQPEQQLLADVLDRFAKQSGNETDAWREVLHVMLCTSEFIYLK